jgi:hypothetical protein
VFAWLEDWLSCDCEHPFHQVVLALQEGMGATVDPQCVIPYLGIVAHLIDDTLGV